MIDLTLEAVQASEFSIYLSGPNNFRYNVFPEYKANRKDVVRPRHLTDLKEYLQNKYNAQVSNGCEADDLLGIEQCKQTEPTVICSIDKDLKQIPGNHYSFETSGAGWVKPASHTEVTDWEGLRFFYYQLLVGDTADGIKGVPGIGKVRAEKLLRDCTCEEHLLSVMREYYRSDEELEMNGACLWIWHKENDIWKIPTLETILREG